MHTQGSDEDRQSPGRVLGVGIATLDIVSTLDAYPAEDSEVRARAQQRVRGGNCANTLAVLADLGRPGVWAGTLADDAGGAFIRADLSGRGIDCAWVRDCPGGTTPTSCVSLSRATGSRTIVHYRDLPELDAAAFARIPLEGLGWVHFEGRHPAETARMLERVKREAPGLPVSVELEKPRPGLAALLEGPDLLLVSRALALAEAGPGADPRDYLADLAGRTSARTLVLGWGAAGAWLLERGFAPVPVPARPPARVLDTLGAGDVLHAGMIDALLAGMDPVAALQRAVALAGLKCARRGLDGLAAAARAAGIL